MHKLGVQISSHKSLVSKDSYEFAKRFVYRGVDVSGAPLNAFIEANSQVSPFIGLIETLSKH